MFRQVSVPNVIDAYSALSTDCNTIQNLVYNRILGITPQTGLYQYEDGVLESYDVKQNADGTCTLTLVVRDDVYFQNGDKLTPADIQFSIETSRDRSTGGNTVYRYITSFTADGNTLSIELSQPHSMLIQTLAGTYVFNKAYFSKVGETEALMKPIGTGPYTVSEFTPGGSCTIEAWPDYWDGQCKIDTITFLCITELNSALMSLEAGDIDMTEINATDIDKVEARKDLVVQSMDSNYVMEMLFNCEKEPFNNLNIRRAFCYAFNRDGFLPLNENLFPNDSAHPKSFTHYYSVPDQITYDMDKARELLEAEGISKDHPLELDYVTFLGDNMRKAVEGYQIDLKSLGVNMSITQLEYNAWIDAQNKGEYTIMSNEWSNGTNSAYYLVRFYASAFIGTYNTQRYTDARMDEIFEELSVTMDLNKQIELAKEAQIIAARDVPKFPLYGYRAFFAYDADITGLEFLGVKAPYFMKADRTQTVG